jgi:hypothetical protein
MYCKSSVRSACRLGGSCVLDYIIELSFDRNVKLKFFLCVIITVSTLKVQTTAILIAVKNYKYLPTGVMEKIPV